MLASQQGIFTLADTRRLNMDIFSIHDGFINNYAEYIQSFLNISDPEIQAYLSKKIANEKILWPDARISLNPAYAPGDSIEKLIQDGVLHPGCKSVFQTIPRLHKHQTQAARLGANGKSYVVTSGTGSGKSLTYLLPIVSHILKNEPTKRSVRAILVYPMNALVNSQENALKSFLADSPVKFSQYTGQIQGEERERIFANPPHILLTNYMMLEYMLTRTRDKVLVDPDHADINFIVFDELHTYRGRQGADVAMLIRRLRERIQNPSALFIGTSATMSSGHDPLERKAAVADFASLMFGQTFQTDQIIEESLERITNDRDPTATEMRTALQSTPPDSYSIESFASNAINIWIENFFGIRLESETWVRQEPKTLEEGVNSLSEMTGIDRGPIREALKQYFLAAARPFLGNNRRPFAFKLHQFITQGGTLYATIDGPKNRQFSVRPQLYAPGSARTRFLFPVVFCRQCGHEYYVADLDSASGQFLPANEDRYRQDESENKEIVSGYFSLTDKDDFSEDIPAEWIDERGRLRPAHRDKIPQAYTIDQLGKPSGSGFKVAFQKQPFSLCLNCGTYYNIRAMRDFTKLSKLSSEGRSTATTITALLASAEFQAQQAEGKLLSFTDSRQDASLQAGHFNDFVNVSLIRRALYSLLRKQGQVNFAGLRAGLLAEMNLPLVAFGRQNQNPTPQILRSIQSTLAELVEYAVVTDMRRGWRFVQPNLEQIGLVQFDYQGLDEVFLAPDDIPDHALWTHQEIFSILRKISEVLLDHARRSLAIDTQILSENYQDRLQNDVRQQLTERWYSICEDWKSTTAKSLMVGGESDNDARVSCGKRSLFARWLRLVAEEKIGSKPTPEEAERAIISLLEYLANKGLLSSTTSGYRVDIARIIWRQGDGKAIRDPLFRRKLNDLGLEPESAEGNVFFRNFYAESPQQIAKAYGAEHTGQINNQLRRDREKLFREGQLSALFCSPTMELGIDISDLNMVHMRNVPPTPANYTQRSGRAGRAGNPALVITYCSNGSGHDQYFFNRPNEMITGRVRPPRMDLSNEVLVKAHIHAVWLYFSSIELTDSIAGLLELGTVGYPLKQDIQKKTVLDPVAETNCRNFCGNLLKEIPEINQVSWFDDSWLDRVLAETPEEFNRAFDQWRELFRSAFEAFVESTQKMQQLALGQINANRTELMSDIRLAEMQMNELKQASGLDSDFYPYRYLASQQFLPGYNFPSQPVRMFIESDDKKSNFVSRPRLIAIYEFGPLNLIYHDGSRYEVRKLLLPTNNPADITRQAKYCTHCGHIVDGTLLQNTDLCERCESKELKVYQSLIKMPDGSARRRDRITSNEEERLRKGYEQRYAYTINSLPGGRSDEQTGRLLAEDDLLAKLDYLKSGTLWNINEKWITSETDGFYLNLTRKTWIAEGKVEEARQNGNQILDGIKPFVSYKCNMLLLRVPEAFHKQEPSFTITLQFAMKAAIQAYFQVEESELGTEIVGEGEQESILFYEAAEGGLGILRRLVQEPNEMAQVARMALDICHYDPDTLEDHRPSTDAEEGCTGACHHCLHTYYNQRYHRYLDRSVIRDYLAEAAKGAVQLSGNAGDDRNTRYRVLREKVTAAPELIKLLDSLWIGDKTLPNEALHRIHDDLPLVDFFFTPETAIFVGSREDDNTLRTDFLNVGYRVLFLPIVDDYSSIIAGHPEVFGK